MKTIKFSHNYPKLHGQEDAVLIKVHIINHNQLSAKLIMYDTDKGDGTYYVLPNTKLIYLLFEGGEGIPFTTIRRYTEGKLKYYQLSIGHLFKIEVTKQND